MKHEIKSLDLKDNGILIDGYKVITENEELQDELLENQKDTRNKINWFLFSQNEKFYNNNGEEFTITLINHDNKIVVIEE